MFPNILLNKISFDVSRKCITRWFPEEIAAGVSDLENLMKTT